MRFIVILLMIITPWISSAQSYFFNHYTEEEGLLDLGIRCMEQDHLGYLWIGSSNGLLRFNGSSFEEVEYHHDNENDAVFDLMLDKSNVLWIASKNGVTSFNGSLFKYYAVQNIDSPWNCYDLTETKNGEIIFFNGPNYLFRIEKGEVKSWKGLLPDQGIGRGQFSTSVNGETFYYNSDGSIWKLNGEYFDPLPVKFSNIFGIVAGTGNDLLVSTNNGLERIILENIEKPIVSTIYKGDSINHFLNQSNGVLWFARKNEIIRLNSKDTLVLNSQKGYTGGQVAGLYEDSEGNIWISTLDKGLFYFHGDVLSFIGSIKNNTFTPTSFISDEAGNMWISYFGKGADRIKNNKITKYGIPEGIASNYIRHVTKNDAGIWFVTARGISLYREEMFSSYSTSDGLPHNYCFYACTDDQQRLWVATEGGIGIFNGNSFSKISKSDGLLNNRIKFLLPRHDKSILLLSDNGIDRAYNDKIEPFIHEGFKEKEILSTMKEDLNGNLWIGSDINGLIYYNSRAKLLTYVNDDHKLPFARIRTIDLLNDNKIVLGTEKGIYIAGISDSGDIDNIYSIGLDNGYPDFEVNTNASQIINKKIYYGTSIGVVILDPDKLYDTLIKIPLHISAIDLEFKHTDWTGKNMKTDSWVNVPLKTLLQYDQNDLMFHYEGVSLLSKSRLSYRYMLENYDQAWSQPTYGTSAIYANLRPGKYKFKVSVSYDGLNWNKSDTSYSFVIAQPIWKTWWFYLLAFSFLLVGFIMVNNYRIRTRINQLLLLEKFNKEEYEKIQKKVAMDFHDEVGNHLTSISLLVQLINNRNWEVPQELKQMLEKIDRESKNLFLGTKDFIWSIDPKNDNLKEVFYNIRDYGEELFDNSDIIFHAGNGLYDIEKIKLPAGFTRQIVLIFKEGINNAMKHAGCKNVKFYIIVKEDYFEIRLVDDGRGFNTDELDYYNGLKKMKSRGDKIKSELSFKSQLDTGTEIVLKANLNKN